jgi:hypothetical protein
MRIAHTALLAVACVATAGAASAQSTIRDPNPPKYSVEIEPKLDLAYLLATGIGGNAFGPGVRFSIPLMSPGFVKTINDSIAIGFGLDILHYDGYVTYGYYGYCNANPRNCPGFLYGTYDTSFWAVHLPVVMQWNFWLSEKWSVFGEPGLTIRHAFFPNYAYCGAYYDPRYGACTPDSTTFYPTFFAGGRFKFSDKLGLTMRLGYPIDFSIGLSIFL